MDDGWYIVLGLICLALSGCLNFFYFLIGNYLFGLAFLFFFVMQVIILYKFLNKINDELQKDKWRNTPVQEKKQ